MLILVRHTAVAGTDGLCYGRTEVALAGSFEIEAAAIRAALPAGDLPVYTSPSARCLRLAERLSPAPTVDARLMELDFGAWEGRRWDDLPRAELDAWSADYVLGAPPGGESFGALAARMTAFAGMVWRRGVRPVVAITHGGPIRGLVARARGLPLAEAFSIAVPPGSIHRVARTTTNAGLRAVS